MRAPSALTVREAGAALIIGAKDGSIRNRSGRPFKPSAIRGYEAALLRINDEFGWLKIGDLRRSDVQAFADRLTAAGMDPSTVRNRLMPLRVIYRRALARDEVALNPTAGLELPAVEGRRDRIASPQEASQLLAALPEDDRPLWASAFYAGLRLGELQALRIEDVDRDARIINVVRSWDPKAGPVAPKSRSGTRKVPIPAVLLPYLLDQIMRTGRRDGLLFGRAPDRPFNPPTIYRRALRAWAVAGLMAIGMHEARHTYASLMIAAGVNIKALSTFMGHGSIQITLDRYGHLLPGSEDEAAQLLDAYLTRACGAVVGQPASAQGVS